MTLNDGLLRADPFMLRLHTDAQAYASAVNASIAVAHGGVSPRPLSNAALYALSADLFGMHRATLSLCTDGWAFAAVVVLRSMIDILMSAAVVTETELEAEYRGFKYVYFFCKAQLIDPGLSIEERSTVRRQITEGIGRLPSAQQQSAKNFMFQERHYGYWFCPEFKRPTDVLDRLSNPDIRALYDAFSGGSHGGYLGLRVLKDEPDRVHPNPRADPRAQHLALATSTRFLIETMNLRDCFENGGAYKRTYDDLMNRLIGLRRA